MKRRVWWLVAGFAVVLILISGIWWQTSASRVESESTPLASPSPSAQKPDVVEQAQELLDQHLESCTRRETSAETVPSGCGIRIPWGTEFQSVETVTFRIEKLPTLQLANPAEPEDGFSASDGVLIATITGTSQDGSPRTETYRTDSWSVRGDLALADGGVEIMVW